MVFRYRLSENVESNEKNSEDVACQDEVVIERENNHIYFYSEVNKSSILQLNKQIKTISSELIKTASVYEIAVPDIKLHINSPGGFMFDGFAAVDFIRNSKAKVHSIVEGQAASAASLMSVVANKRSINKHSFMLIHQLSGGSIGKYEEMADDFENSKTLMEAMRNIYLEKTKIPLKTLNDLLKRDLYLDAKQCLKYGLVDEILE